MSSDHGHSSWISSATRFPAFVPRSAPASEELEQVPALPYQYGVDVLRLLPRHPTGLFAYWDVSDGAKRKFLDQLRAERIPSNGRWELRWGLPGELGMGPWPGARLGEVTWLHGVWYFDVAPDAAGAQVWLGYTIGAGQFFPWLRSNFVDLRSFFPTVGAHGEPRLRWRRQGGPDVDAPGQAVRAFRAGSILGSVGDGPGRGLRRYLAWEGARRAGSSEGPPLRSEGVTSPTRAWSNRGGRV